MPQTGFQKSPPGQRYVIPTSVAYDAMIDAALAHRAQRTGRGQSAVRQALRSDTILVRNDSGGDVARFGILGINGPIIDRVDNDRAFFERVAVQGVTPTADHAGRFAVLQEPVANGAMGRALVDGVCLVKVEMVDEDHVYAEAAEGITAGLRSTVSGSTTLLWVEPLEQRASPDVAWCIARIGNVGAGGGALAFCALLTAVGSSPPYTYTAKHAEPGTWTQSGDDFALVNVLELGPRAYGMRRLEAGDIVPYWIAGGTAYCSVLHYRGTY